MMDVGRHPKINLLTYSEIEDISGFAGNFHVKVRKKARYIDEDECTACGDCVDLCPVTAPHEYDYGLSTRKAIYIPFPQAVPSSYLINMDNCLGNNPIACGKCLEQCEKKCINYDMRDEIFDFDVGVIITATGIDIYDPTPLDEFGYTRFENVLTSMELETLLRPGGPSNGHLIRPSDQKIPKSVGFIQCVGSRSEKRGNPYCSNYCCMNTIKETLIIKEHHSEIEIKVFYMDIRAFGKGFEDLYIRSKENGVKFIRGIPGEIEEDPRTRALRLYVEDTTNGGLKKHDLDMAVLAVGAVPRINPKLHSLLTLSKTPDGFLLEAHPKLKPIDAPTTGIFFAGCCEYPKDVKDSVTQASAASSRAGTVLSAGNITIEAITSKIDGELCCFCGICAKVCPYKAITVDPKKKIPASVVEAMCKGCGTCGAECRFDAITMQHFTDDQIMTQIEAALEDRREEKIVVFACNWCSFAGGDNAGLSKLQYPTSPLLIRTMCSGRVDEKFILKAFELGAPIVLVSGCHFADCHYIDANRWTQKRVEKLWDKLERWGIRPERLQLEWISAAEGGKFAKVMWGLEEIRRKVTKEEVKETMRILLKKKR